MKHVLAGIALLSLFSAPASGANLTTSGLYRMCATGPINPEGMSVPHTIVGTYASAIADTHSAYIIAGLKEVLCLPPTVTPEALAIVTCRAVLDAPDLEEKDAAYFVGFALSAAYPCDLERHKEISQQIYPDLPEIVYSQP